MALNWKLCILIALFSSQLTHSFIILDPTGCQLSDNELSPPNPKCSWIEKALKSLPKYRNFFAGLLQEASGEFAYELQEIFNAICEAMVENDRRKQREQLTIAKWLMDNNKKLNEYLLKKGIWKI
ncbi:uncharacterized protein LOC119613740 [Lucilia sericata]|uniref:uncharacterized protein LOC119613740 n=1 Tax=Lucilia sericata TaxID=13632 RepID=UPI0018A7ECA8|nr:uncharacterized protein LOC119613740 [Lucilia sericata]